MNKLTGLSILCFILLVQACGDISEQNLSTIQGETLSASSTMETVSPAALITKTSTQTPTITLTPQSTNSPTKVPTSEPTKTSTTEPEQTEVDVGLDDWFEEQLRRGDHLVVGQKVAGGLVDIKYGLSLEGVQGDWEMKIVDEKAVDEFWSWVFYKAMARDDIQGKDPLYTGNFSQFKHDLDAGNIQSLKIPQIRAYNSETGKLESFKDIEVDEIVIESRSQSTEEQPPFETRYANDYDDTLAFDAVYDPKGKKLIVLVHYELRSFKNLSGEEVNIPSIMAAAMMTGSIRQGRWSEANRIRLDFYYSSDIYRDIVDKYNSTLDKPSRAGWYAISVEEIDI